MSWSVFENLFWEAYFNPHHQRTIAVQFEALYHRDMTVTEYYNWFMELAKYCMTRNVDTPVLILRFTNRLRQPIVDKIVKHRFTTLMDYYASTQLVEANVEAKNAKYALARNPGNNKKMT